MFRRSGALAVLILALTCAPAYADAEVQLRVEGDDRTFFEGPVKTGPKNIDKDGGHPCNGRDNGPRPGNGGTFATFTTALDDSDVSWDANWNEDFNDFLIDRIESDESGKNDSYWGVAANYEVADVGGCQEEVEDGDDVLWAFDLFSADHLLLLTGPLTAKVGEEVELRVEDGKDDDPVGGARVEGSGTDGGTTNGDGVAEIEFGSDGVQKLKAEEGDSIRSNELEICVYRDDADECAGFEPESVSRKAEGDRERGDTDGDDVVDEGDDIPGVLDDGTPGGPGTAVSGLLTSIRNGALYRRGPSVIAGAIEQAGRLHGVYFRLRRIENGACSWYSGAQQRFIEGRCSKARYFRLGEDPEFSFPLERALPSGRYILDLKALDLELEAVREQVRFEVR